MRRLTARLRPLLLPVALVVAAAIAVDGWAPRSASDDAAVVTPVAPQGRVLVAVSPTDPASLSLAPPGTRVDVYGAVTDAITGLDGSGGGSDGGAPARRLASDALVMGPVGTAPGGDTSGPLAVAQPAASALTLAVTDDEAAVLAAQQGRGLMLAIRGRDRTGGHAPDGGTG